MRKFFKSSKSEKSGGSVASLVGQKSALDLINNDKRSKDNTTDVTIQAFTEFPRILERRFGESLGYRMKMLSNFTRLNKVGLGPPDLVHITLYDKFHRNEIGEYFYVTGVDVSAESTPIALLKMLKLNRKSKSTGQENNVSTYCSLNIFSHCDLRIRYEADSNTYQVKVVDCMSGVDKGALTEQLWEEAFVSCCLRSITFNYDKERKLPGLMEFPLGIHSTSDNLPRKVIEILCKFLPRCLESGWDSTTSLNCNLLHNYLTQSLLQYISIAPRLTQFAFDLLRNLCEVDLENAIYYKVAKIAILFQQDENDVEFVSLLNTTLASLFPLLDTLEKKDAKMFQTLSTISDLLNLQIRFLLARGDFALALPLAIKSTEVSLDSFESWHLLAMCYMEIEEYEKALLAINCMPNLPVTDKIKKRYYCERALYDYYQRPLGNKDNRNVSLDSNEFNLVSNTMEGKKDEDVKKIIFGRLIMPNESRRGYIERIWGDICLQLGPIYGLHSCNLINFVSRHEIESVHDIKLLRRNNAMRQYSLPQQRVYALLMELKKRIGWNNLLELRAGIFIMDNEYRNDNSLNSYGYGRNKDVPSYIRRKRVCERWLDQLFLDTYQDLLISNEAVLDNADVKFNGLEWELLGLTMMRVGNWSDAVACLRTSVTARFDPISAEKILKLYLDSRNPYLQTCDPVHLDPDLVIDLLVQKISYDCRFYDGFQMANLQVLFELSQVLGTEAIRNRVAMLPFAAEGIIQLVDSMLAHVAQPLDHQPLAS
ncbi:Chs6p KNAG_0B01740 [Huiozyma naganishii CBS 8797]|uniref:Uncharacterized protein n=1 Tax=Huiozyma naganishii (strain ATCC MYA-139 / BCRC 22969 / CBS 8797 / KCTC 17520 / NBRC 10181 / NCYC 3082 / Yp74L-3) TaxID=1071383 RepID=J7RUT1_HUIN7|nr:hypothetical protein KNAG_0B01740 [Kazachstania naganishii CBS 8797]CCK68617.1 hypothetical protein KNAG_0B01740 [Kazachstania naganishii CBS 8797]